MQRKDDVFAIILALRYLLPKEEFKAFKASLQRLITKVIAECPHISEDQLLAEMGLPANWKKITLLKIS